MYIPYLHTYLTTYIHTYIHTHNIHYIGRCLSQGFATHAKFVVSVIVSSDCRLRQASVNEHSHPAVFEWILDYLLRYDRNWRTMCLTHSNQDSHIITYLHTPYTCSLTNQYFIHTKQRATLPSETDLHTISVRGCTYACCRLM